jgi:hypothetical protein
MLRPRRAARDKQVDVAGCFIGISPSERLRGVNRRGVVGQ